MEWNFNHCVSDDFMQQIQLQTEEILKTERVTETEAQQIVQLWAENQKQAATQSGPTVHDIAEGLEIPPEEAHRLLQQVREKQVAQVEQRVQIHGRSALVVAAIIMALIAVMLGWMLVGVRQPSPPATIRVEAPVVEPARTAPPNDSPLPPARVAPSTDQPR
jgi:transcription initiation factor TFIIIB Brf1 subunit/transcription initiation factor TFIIB